MIVDDVKDFWQSRDETAALVGMWEHMKLKWARKKSQILGELDKSANKFSEKISSLPYHQPSNGDSLKILPQYQSIFLHWCNANFRAQDINTNALKQNTHKKSLKKVLVYLFPQFSSSAIFNPLPILLIGNSSAGENKTRPDCQIVKAWSLLKWPTLCPLPVSFVHCQSFSTALLVDIFTKKKYWMKWTNVCPMLSHNI